MRPIVAMNRGGVAVSTRGGHTLLETLIAVVVVMIMAATATAMYGHAMQQARAAHTQMQITKIERVVNERWENYETRRVPVSASHRLYRQVERINALRELMRLELPDRKSDVIDDPVTPGLRRPAASQFFLRQVPANPDDWSTTYQGAECLYLILLVQRGNGLAHIKADTIGDKDGDGMKEIHDAWGNPIEFLRWAPGFRSPRQTCNTVTDPDPLDPFHVYIETYALYPLIYSAGPDGAYHLVADIGGGQVRYSKTFPPNNPYLAIGSFSMGKPIRGMQGHVDNLDNHGLARAYRP